MISARMRLPIAALVLLAGCAAPRHARLREQLPTAWPRLETRLAEFLPSEQAERATAVLRRELEE